MLMKQWALDHKEFPSFKEERIGKAQQSNAKVDELLKKPEIQEEIKKILLEQKKSQEAQTKSDVVLLLRTIGIFFLLGVFIYLFQWIEDRRDSKDQSLNIVKTELVRKV